MVKRAIILEEDEYKDLTVFLTSMIRYMANHGIDIDPDAMLPRIFPAFIELPSVNNELYICDCGDIVPWYKLMDHCLCYHPEWDIMSQELVGKFKKFIGDVDE